MLYLVTNRKLAKINFYQVIEEAVAGGVDAIILREKDLSTQALKKMAMKIKECIQKHPVKLMVNSNLQVAREIEGAGCHIPFSFMLKEKPAFNGLLGVSVHSLEEAVIAEKNGANYLLAGHVFETRCKEGMKPRGIQWIQSLKEEVNIPVIAIGGIHQQNLPHLLETGVDGIAVMSLIMEAENPYRVTKQLKEIMSKKFPTFNL
ncbi:MAG: thiamine phosphate synthase [Bacillota bacterium]